MLTLSANELAIDGGGSHFVAFYGYVDAGPAGGEQVNVADPLYDSHLVPLDVLEKSYPLLLGHWNATYHTK